MMGLMELIILCIIVVILFGPAALVWVMLWFIASLRRHT